MYNKGRSLSPCAMQAIIENAKPFQCWHNRLNCFIITLKVTVFCHVKVPTFTPYFTLVLQYTAGRSRQFKELPLNQYNFSNVLSKCAYCCLFFFFFTLFLSSSALNYLSSFVFIYILVITFSLLERRLIVNDFLKNIIFSS